MSLENNINDFLNRRLANHAEIVDYKKDQSVKTTQKQELADHDAMQANGEV